MAKSTSTKKKKSSLDAMAGTDDPRAALDSAALLDASRKVLARLEDDLRQRAEASPAVTRALRDQYEREKAAERTAETFAGWSAALATQVAAAWLLSCVFVRTLEDRGLLRQARIAGPGAMDSQRLFFQLAPSLTERDYLLMVWKELAQYPAARGLFDAEHSLVWKLSPSAEMAKELLALFRTPTAETPAFRFGQASTRFLGDLYQDLSEDVRKRYALLQTPDFVESFILDRTLEPAVVRFGLDDTTVIDPTCGSGHFLLGAFGRLFEHRRRLEPGVDARVAAVKAVDAVYGADINPYAVAIARFRLTLEVLEKAGYAKLADAPALPLHVVVADSLLHNPRLAQTTLGTISSQSTAAWDGLPFFLEDETLARKVLGREHAAVVGNPPFGDPNDKSRKELYRRQYASASGKYTLSAPFTEAFLDYGRNNGFVGLINSMAFANKLYGTSLIEQVLRKYDVTHVLSAAGVYFPPPGFSTATGILLMRKAPALPSFQMLRQVAPDPGKYQDPSKGRVWQAILAHCDDDVYKDDYIQVERAPRAEIDHYPWKLIANSADSMAERIESVEHVLLDSLCAGGIGPPGMSNADELFQVDAGHPICEFEPGWFRHHLTGESVRDYMLDASERVFWPYDEDLRLRPLPSTGPLLRWLHPYRTHLEARATFKGGTYATDPKRVWYQWHQVTPDRVQPLRRVAFPELMTEVNFVRVPHEASLSQSLMCFSPRPDIDDVGLCAMLGYLNSSTAGAWLKSRCAPVGTARGDVSVEKGKTERFRLPANMAARLPIPRGVLEGRARARLAALYVHLEELGRRRVLARAEARQRLIQGGLADSAIGEWKQVESELLAHSVVLQEELDWCVYGLLFDLSHPEASLEELGQATAAKDERPAFCASPLVHGSERLAAIWKLRREEVIQNPVIEAVEAYHCKRSWLGRRGVFGRNRLTMDELAERMIAEACLERASMWLQSHAAAPQKLAALRAAADISEARGLGRDDVDAAGVPFCSAYYLDQSGALTQEANLQGAGLEFEQSDFLDEVSFRLRGAWNAPKERFISYPGCESDDDGEPVYGWAGWDHLQRAQALAALYMDRKTREGWPRERLVPMLAGLLELIPWVKQWHNEPSAEYDGLRMGDYFAQFLDGELRLHSLTPADLRAWRPAKKSRTKSKPAAPAADDVAASDGPPPKPKRRRKPKAERRAAGPEE